VNVSGIQFSLLQHRSQPIRGLEFYDSAQPDRYRAALRSAEAALAFAPDAEVIRWLPSAGLGSQFLADLAADPEWTLARRIEDRAGVGPVYVYRRPPVFVDALEAKGFGPIEGPYPQWGLPRVRWGLGAGSTLVVSGAANAKARLVIEVRAPMEGQMVSIAIDGEPRGVFAAPSGTAFRRHEVEFAYPASGKAVIAFAYAKPAERAVLFRMLRVARAKVE
jgi:hypothetical protein